MEKENVYKNIIKDFIKSNTNKIEKLKSKLVPLLLDLYSNNKSINSESDRDTKQEKENISHKIEKKTIELEAQINLIRKLNDKLEREVLKVKEFCFKVEVEKEDYGSIVFGKYEHTCVFARNKTEAEKLIEK